MLFLLIQGAIKSLRFFPGTGYGIDGQRFYEINSPDSSHPIVALLILSDQTTGFKDFS